MNPDPTTETLLRHGRFVQELARALVRDRHAAEDLAQETWTRWLRRPSPPSNPRGWLGRVAHRLASNQHRAAERRVRHEALGAREEGVDSPDRAVEEGEVLRRVVEAVLALEEPYRETILARYFRGQGTREQAEQRGEPLATVRSRERRALELLRRRLDRGPGGRAAWAAGLARFLPGMSLAGSVGLWLSAAVLLLASSAILWGRRAPAAADAPAPLARSALPDATKTRRDSTASEAAFRGERLPIAPGPDDPVGAAARGSREPPLQGETVDPSGRALAGVRVRVTGLGKPVEALSDEQGRFELAGLSTIRAIDAQLEGYRLLYATDPEGDPMDGWQPLRVTLAPTGTLRVRVLDGLGLPLEGVDVRAGLRAEERLDPTDSRPTHKASATIEAATDAEGRAELAGVWSGARLVLDLDPEPGVDSSELRADRQLDGRLVVGTAPGEPIVLQAGGTRELTAVWGLAQALSGLVVDVEGAPVEKARVELQDDGYGPREAGYRLAQGVTGADGRFVLAFRPAALRGPLRLRATGFHRTHALTASSLSTPEGFATCWLEPVRLANPEDMRLTLVARAPDVLAGVLLDSCGVPLRESGVLFPLPKEGGLAPGAGASVRTSEGGFALLDLPEPRYDVLVTASLRSEACPSPVFTRFFDQLTGDFGLRLRLPPSAPVRLRIEGGAFRRVRLARLLADRSDLRGGTVAPRTLLLRDPAPWLASPAGTRIGPEGPWVQVDQRGGLDVTLELGEPGWYRVGAESAPPLAPVATERLWFEAGLHVLQLDPPAATGILHGHLLADGGRAFYGFLLVDEQGQALPMDGPSADPARDARPIRASGVFVLRDLVPGAYRLRFGTLEELAAGRWARELAVVIAAGENSSIEVRL